MSHVGRPNFSIPPSGGSFRLGEAVPQKARDVFRWYVQKYGEDASTQAFRKAGIERKGASYRGKISAEQHQQIKSDVREATGFVHKTVRRCAQPMEVQSKLVTKYGAPATKAAFAKAGIDIDGTDRHRLLNAEQRRSLEEGARKLDLDALIQKCESSSYSSLEKQYAHLCWNQICKTRDVFLKFFLAASASSRLLRHLSSSSIHGGISSRLELDPPTFDRFNVVDRALVYQVCKERRENISPESKYVGLYDRGGAVDNAFVQSQNDKLAALCDKDGAVRDIVTAPRFEAFFTPRPASDRDGAAVMNDEDRTVFDIFDHQRAAYRPEYEIDEDALDDPEFYKRFAALCDAAFPPPMEMNRNFMMLAMTEALRPYIRPAQATPLLTQLQFFATQLGVQFQLPVELIGMVSRFVARAQTRDDFEILPTEQRD